MRNALFVLIALVLPLTPSHDALTVRGPIAPDNVTQVQCDVPESIRIQNTGGIDGAGLCVFASISVAARWQNETKLINLFDQMTHERGGGWPEKVDKMIAKYGKGAQYIQYQGNDLAILKMALKCGRIPAVTWNGAGDPHYGTYIAHMVNLVHLDTNFACILDNNYPGSSSLVWMSPKEFANGWAARGSGWAVILLDKGPPPPIPANYLKKTRQEPTIYSGAQYRWKWYKTDPQRVYLIDEWSRTIGAYDWPDKYFRFYDLVTKRWLKKTTPPYDPPPLPKDKKTQVLQTFYDFGTPWLADYPPRAVGEELCSLNGQECTVQQAWMELARASFKKNKDDADAIRLTIIGGPAFRKQILTDLVNISEAKDFLIQDYDLNTWPLLTVGLPCQKEQIIVQRPPGKNGQGRVIHRQIAYDGPGPLAKALRRANPAYDPKADPDLRKDPPKGPKIDQPQTDFTLPLWIGGAGLIGSILSWIVRPLIMRPRIAPQVPIPTPPPALPTVPQPAHSLHPLLDVIMNAIFQQMSKKLEDYLARVADRTVAQVLNENKN